MLVAAGDVVDDHVARPDFASRKSKNPNEIKVKEAEKAK
jgi:hypothetical protein